MAGEAAPTFMATKLHLASTLRLKVISVVLCLKRQGVSTNGHPLCLILTQFR